MELNDLLERIENHVDTIYVRETLRGRTASYSLAELPAELALKHVFRWIRKQQTGELGRTGLTAGD